MAGLIVFCLFVGLITGSISAAVASGRGRRGGAFFALGFFFGLLGLILTVCITAGDRSPARY